ncbi:MAG TPA: efflux RND transporter permease subunit [Patescibacteria group bacterium]|nr:efflux RND transporter permease subunit [Patescibacteria group bacterium]
MRSIAQVSIEEHCTGERLVTKIDDGYTGKENTVIEVLLNRNALTEKQLTVPNAPLSMLVNQTLKELFDLNNSGDGIIAEIDGEATHVVLEKIVEDPKTIDEIKNTPIYSTAGQQVLLGDIATVSEQQTSPIIQRVKGETVGVVYGRLKEGKHDQQYANTVTQAVLNYYQQNEGQRLKDMHVKSDSIESYSGGATASTNESFQELFFALGIAIILTYIVLVVFFGSFLQPLVVLFTIPLTFIGIFPGVSYFANAQIGFLEIIGVIILVGIVENVAIFLLDAARQKIAHEKWEKKKAIAFASGVRLRPVLLTKFTAIASLTPLALLSETYRSISIVIMFGLLTSGVTSLFTTPILYIFFEWIAEQVSRFSGWKKILFVLFFPIAVIVVALQQHIQRRIVKK